MKNNSIIRIAKAQDVGEILEIYKPFILNTTATFEELVPSVSEFEQRVMSILNDAPFLVCEIDCQIAGYAYAGAHRSRSAYRWDREVSVYVHPHFQRKNIGKALYHALFKLVKMQGFANLLAGITLPNKASVLFHESFGFTKCGEYHQVGYKLGKWQTVGWWELSLLGSTEAVPTEPISFTDIRNNEEVEEILKKATAFLKL